MESIRSAADATGRSGGGGRVARGAWALAAVGWAALIWWLSDQPDPNPTSGGLSVATAPLAHVAVFGVLCALLRAAGAPLAVAAALALGWGVLDELHQRSTPGRDATPEDVGWDALGIATAVWVLRRRR
jgi:VanZ family protein